MAELQPADPTVYRTGKRGRRRKYRIPPPKGPEPRFWQLLRLMQQAILNDVEVTRIRPSEWRPGEALHFTVTSQWRDRETGEPATTYRAAIWPGHGCGCSCPHNRGRTWANARPCAHLTAVYANLLGWRNAVGAQLPGDVLGIYASFIRNAPDPLAAVAEALGARYEVIS